MSTLSWGTWRAARSSPRRAPPLGLPASSSRSLRRRCASWWTSAPTTSCGLGPTASRCPTWPTCSAAQVARHCTTRSWTCRTATGPSLYLPRCKVHFAFLQPQDRHSPAGGCPLGGRGARSWRSCSLRPCCFRFAALAISTSGSTWTTSCWPPRIRPSSTPCTSMPATCSPRPAS